jgi:hypothetical protein
MSLQMQLRTVTRAESDRINSRSFEREQLNREADAD